MEKLISLKSVIIDFIPFLSPSISRFQDQSWNGKCVIIICFVTSSSACCIERKFNFVLFYLWISHHHHHNLTQLITSKDAGHMSNFQILKIVIFSAQKATVALENAIWIHLLHVHNISPFSNRRDFDVHIIIRSNIG